MTVVIRHAKAGDRSRWSGDDRLRPLTTSGELQAAGLVETLADFAIDRIVSSPYARCAQTVQPLAAARGLAVETHDALAEGGDARLLFAANVALCSHGDVIENLLPRGALCQKASVWVFEFNGTALVPVRYIAPPSV